MYDDYDLPDELYQEQATGPSITWREIWMHRALVEADLHSEYGVDLSTVLRSRTGRWLRVRVWGLLSEDTRLYRAVIRKKK